MKKVVSLMLLALTFSACNNNQEAALNKKIFRSMELAYERIGGQLEMTSPNWNIINEYLDYLSTAAIVKNKINTIANAKQIKDGQ